MQITIRRYIDGDVKFLYEIFYNTIHIINANDYTKEQLNAWAPKSSLDKLNEWQINFEKIKPFVALIDNVIVGFAEFESHGHIECFYVHHKYQGCGVGSALMDSVDAEAQRQALSKVNTEVSITAKDFFEHKGFKILKKTIYIIDGVGVTYFYMEKYYNPINRL